jgi:hypothetical protein
VFLRVSAAAFLLLIAQSVQACSCADVSRASPARLDDFFTQAERVVHARVRELISTHEARVEVIESFKGAGERLESLAAGEAGCGFAFARGEERVYFVFGGVVNLCGRAEARPDLLRRLRGMKLADAAVCEGVPRPARTPGPATIKEDEDPPYEPLHGSDPDFRLGVGHVRPAREEDRDDWTRRIVLPVFAAPDGEIKLWLTPGTVGSDALVETGYETASFIVLQARRDGWLQIRFGGPLASGAGWVHRCHLDAATPRLQYQAWESLLADAGTLYFRSWAPHALRSSAKDDAPRIAVIPADPNRYGMQPLEFRGDWARVRVSMPSTVCANPKPRRPAVREGWVRWRSRDRGPWLWYYTRGC